jgi:hypothetical protein
MQYFRMTLFILFLFNLTFSYFILRFGRANIIYITIYCFLGSLSLYYFPISVLFSPISVLFSYLCIMRTVCV